MAIAFGPHIVAVFPFKIRSTRRPKVPCPLTQLPLVPSLTVKSIGISIASPLSSLHNKHSVLGDALIYFGNCVYMPHTIFWVKYRFPFRILRFFTETSPSVTQRSVSQENAFKNSKNLSLFFLKPIGSNNSFMLIGNNFGSEVWIQGNSTL